MIPNFNAIMLGGGTQESITAWVVCILLIVFFIGILITLAAVCRAQYWIMLLGRALAQVTPTDAPSARRKILGALATRKQLSLLWAQYNQGLIEISESRTESNTSASTVFSPAGFKVDLQRNRFLVSVPGFLTAIGVIGTFVGLQMGLATLGSSDEMPSPETLRQGIFGIIGGASIAFTTSIWGVGTSLIFNMVEKILDTLIKSKIDLLTRRIDTLYPIANVSRGILELVKTSNESNECLRTLDEKIASKLQEAMASSNDAVGESLQCIVEPLLKDLSERSASNTAQLEGLISKFIDQASSAGDQYRASVESASLTLGGITESFTEVLSNATVGIKSELGGLAQDIAATSEKALDGVNARIAEQNSEQEEMHQRFAQIVSDLAKIQEEGAIVSKENAQTSKTWQSISQQLTELSTAVQGTAETVSACAEQNKTAAQTFSSIIEDMKGMSKEVSALSKVYQTVLSNADEGLLAIRESNSEQSQALKEHAHQLESHIASLLNQYSSRVDAHTNERMNAWISQTNEFLSVMVDAMKALSSIVDEIESKTQLTAVS